MTNPPMSDSTPTAVIDEAALLERFEGDRELLREVVGLFFDDCPRRLADIHAALESGNCEAVERAAHSIKGSVGNFAAPAAVDAALRLEMIGRSGDLACAAEACAALEREIDRLQGALAAFV